MREAERFVLFKAIVSKEGCVRYGIRMSNGERVIVEERQESVTSGLGVTDT